MSEILRVKNRRSPKDLTAPREAASAADTGSQTAPPWDEASALTASREDTAAAKPARGARRMFMGCVAGAGAGAGGAATAAAAEKEEEKEEEQQGQQRWRRKKNMKERL
jgi:hypothetical protein